MNGHDLQSARACRCRFFELLRRLKLCASGRPALNITRLLKVDSPYKKNLDLGSNSLYYWVAIFAGLSIAVSRHMARFQHVRSSSILLRVVSQI